MANQHRYKPEIERLLADNQHRTADDIYAHLKKTYRFLGKGTVYRVLQILVDEGSIMKKPGVIDKILFEAMKPPHGHLVCKQSGMIMDVMIDQLAIEELDMPDGFVPEQVHVRIDGHFTDASCTVDARINHD